MKKILIIDDKNIEDQHSSTELIKSLPLKYQEFVIFRNSPEDLWEYLDHNQDKLILKFSIQEYSFIFLHQSIGSPLLSNPVLLLNELPSGTLMVLFSGGRSSGLGPKDNRIDNSSKYDFEQSKYGDLHYEIKREIYFNNFRSFMEEALESGEYNINYLYWDKRTVSIRELRVIREQIKDLLEESNEKAINSEYFTRFFRIAMYKPEDIVLIKNNFINKEPREISNLLDYEISNLKIK
jgi:hypothetical protein